MPTIERPEMSDYGVLPDLAGALPWAWAEERLMANRNYWLVTVSGAGRPHAMPVWGVWLPDSERFWFSCSPTARKARNIAENARCVVTVDDTVECVSLEGWASSADEVRDGDAADEMVAAYLAKYWEDPAVHAEMGAFLRSNLMFEVTPERAFGIIERDEEFARAATRWTWPVPA